MTPGSGYSIGYYGDTTYAPDYINEKSEVSCWGKYPGGVERVYEFTVPAGGLYMQVDLEYCDFDTQLAIVEGCPDGDSFCLHNDDYQGYQSGFDCRQYTEGTYSAIVTGYKLEKGNYMLEFVECQ
jgi:hypothetical protein